MASSSYCVTHRLHTVKPYGLVGGKKEEDLRSVGSKGEEEEKQGCELFHRRTVWSAILGRGVTSSSTCVCQCARPSWSTCGTLIGFKAPSRPPDPLYLIFSGDGRNWQLIVSSRWLPVNTPYIWPTKNILRGVPLFLLPLRCTCHTAETSALWDWCAHPRILDSGPFHELNPHHSHFVTVMLTAEWRTLHSGGGCEYKRASEQIHSLQQRIKTSTPTQFKSK